MKKATPQHPHRCFLKGVEVGQIWRVSFPGCNRAPWVAFVPGPGWISDHRNRKNAVAAVLRFVHHRKGAAQ